VIRKTTKQGKTLATEDPAMKVVYSAMQAVSSNGRCRPGTGWRPWTDLWSSLVTGLPITS